jgi:predicted amidohydrolase
MSVTVPESANREVSNLRISIVHMKIRDTIDENLKAAKAGILKAAAQKPAFIALPEYFSVPGCMQNFTDAEKIFRETREATLEFLTEVSMEIPGIYLLGGTVLDKKNEKLYNTSTLWKNGLLIGKYRKKNPIAAEIKAGVARGNQAVVMETEYCKVGLIICADMFDPNLVKQVVSLGAEVISLPVAAMGTHPSVKGHPLTEKVATDNGVFVIKVGNVCSSAKGGRSAVIAPWGILEEVSDAEEDLIITVDLDMTRLDEYRKTISKPWPSHPRSGSSH